MAEGSETVGAEDASGKKGTDWFQVRRWGLIIANTIMVTYLVVQLIFLIPLRQGSSGSTSLERFTMENEARKTNVQIVGGLFFLVTAFLTWETVRISAENLKVAQRNVVATEAKLEQDKLITKKTLEVAEANLVAAQVKQTSERFIKATECLGSSDTLTRIGGVYSLEHVAKESSDDFNVVMEVLAAFVRHRALNTDQKMSDDDLRLASENVQVRSGLFARSDIQAALYVFSRRFAYRPNVLDDKRVVLIATDLKGLKFTSFPDLHESIFDDTSFGFSNLTMILADECKFQNTNFYGADLRFASCVDSDFSDSNFEGADLAYADFQGSKFPDTSFLGAKLTGTILAGADLSKSQDLTQRQIDSAEIDADTKLPNGLFNKYIPGG